MKEYNYSTNGLQKKKFVSEKGILFDIETLHEAYQYGLFGDQVHEVFPEIDQNSLEWRLYFSLPCAINYQRKSEGLWNAALKTFTDPDTRFVFDCRNVSLGIDRYRIALTKHKLALQPEKQTLIWYKFSKALLELGDGDPDKFFFSLNYDIKAIKDFIVNNKKSFPYVSGPKLLNYWLYIYDYFVNVDFLNKQEITVIPDVHVKRATIQLGLVDISKSDDTNLIAEIWQKTLKGTKLAPCDLHAPLWRWSRAGFPPIEDIRTGLINLQK